jgi:hypothetical protein
VSFSLQPSDAAGSLQTAILGGAVLALSIGACSAGPGTDPEALARTMVAGTAAAASPTPRPTGTKAPSLTPTSSPTAPPPTATSTATPEPGPIVFADDFGEQTDEWLNCRTCEWTNGVLRMGPFPPSATLDRSSTICGPCGDSSYFRLAVDVTHVEGQTDRGYGLGFWWGEEELWAFEISPLFLLTLGVRYEIPNDLFELTNPNPDQLLSGLVRPGYATNRLEIIVQPAGVESADIYYRVNGKNAFVLYNKPRHSGQVGLVVGFHSIQVAFDNFEFEELEP